MVSAIDPTKPVDGVAADKADLRANLLAAKNEIEALQAGGPTVAQWNVLARLASGTGAPTGITDEDLTAEPTPASGDFLLGWVGGQLRKFDVGLIPGLGGDPFDDVDDGADYSVTPFEVGLTGANKNEQRRFTGNQNHQIRFTAANLANGDFGWLIRGGSGTVTLVYNDIPINNGTVSIGLKSKVKWTVHDGEVLIDGGTNETVDFDSVPFIDSELRDHSETINALGNVSGALTVNYELGHNVTLTLTGNATSLAITNPPASGKAGWITFYINHGTGPFTWAHPSGVKHADNTAPTLSGTASRRSVLTYVTLDGGSTWLSFLGGKDYPL